MNDDDADFSAWGLIGQVGFIVVIALGIGLAIGLGVDSIAHTKPIFTLVGVTVGFALGLAAVYRTATDATRRAEAAYMRRRGEQKRRAAVPPPSDDEDDD